MSFQSGVQWGGIEEMRARMREYGGQVLEAVRAVGEYYAPVLEAYAKEGAPWTDQTGNARQSLHTFVEDLSRESVALYLAHGMDYGKYLELRFAGRYAIIWPTIEAHLDVVARTLQEVFS